MTSAVDCNFLTNWSRYHDFLHQQVFFDLADKHVLEIAPHIGEQTQVIMRYDTQSLTLVEPDAESVRQLQQKYPRANIICQDIFETYQSSLPCDVVVCCGLLYHLHSPLYLLECIVNQSRPQSIILDNLHCDSIGQGGPIYESINLNGNMFASRKVIPYVITFPFVTIQTAMMSLGYTKIFYANLNEFQEIPQKKDSWVARWEKT